MKRDEAFWYSLMELQHTAAAMMMATHGTTIESPATLHIIL